MYLKNKNQSKDRKVTSHFSARIWSHHEVISQSKDDPGFIKSAKTIIKTYWQKFANNGDGDNIYIRN